MNLTTHNKHAEHFDAITDQFINDYQGRDDELLIIGLKHLVEHLLRQKAIWPEDILGFADYVQDRYDDIKPRNRRSKDAKAWKYVLDFLQEDEFIGLKELVG